LIDDADLPIARFQRRHLLRDLAHRGDMIRPQVSSAFEDVRGDEKREVNPLTAP